MQSIVGHSSFRRLLQDIIRYPNKQQASRKLHELHAGPGPSQRGGLEPGRLRDIPGGAKPRVSVLKPQNPRGRLQKRVAPKS